MTQKPKSTPESRRKLRESGRRFIKDYKPWELTVPDEQLLQAVQAGDLDGVLRALDRGADPNTVKFPQTHVLTIAARADCPQIVQVLVDAGADLPDPE